MFSNPAFNLRDQFRYKFPILDVKGRVPGQLGGADLSFFRLREENGRNVYSRSLINIAAVFEYYEYRFDC